MAESTTTDQAPAQSNGAGAPDTAQIDVLNPATGQSIGSVPVTSPEQVTEMVARARATQPGWEALGFEGRGAVLKRCRAWVLENSDRIIDTIVKETGKTYEDAQLAEVSYAAAAFGFWAKKAPKYLADERIHASSVFVKGKKIVLRYEPLGVVGVIGPWNYPLTNSFGDCIPALAAGNAVILKPSEVTPFTSLLMKEMLDECGLPKDIYQVATGYGETGAALVNQVDYLMFTGSTATGKKVLKQAADTLTPVGLELGGKDPMIVLRDADMERAANAAVFYSMQNAGQTCISTERVYVEEPVYDEFVDRVTEKVRAIRQGPAGGPGSQEIGAVIFPPQAEVVDGHVKDAVAKGAKVLAGGHRRDGEGDFYEPTVLVDVDHSMSCMTEETFGPTLPIMKVGDADEALRLANDTPYGLQASVWTKDVGRGERLAREVEAGVVTVNDAQINYLALELPMGGWKESGLGSRHGADGIRKYCRKQGLVITRFAPKRDMHMFPYTEKMTRRLGKAIRFLNGRGKS